VVWHSYPQVYNEYMKNFIYTFLCTGCGSELEFKSMNKASDEAMCMCGLQMKLIRYWAISAELDSYPQV
jgi:hypothetical protein